MCSAAAAAAAAATAAVAAVVINYIIIVVYLVGDIVHGDSTGKHLPWTIIPHQIYNKGTN